MARVANPADVPVHGTGEGTAARRAIFLDRDGVIIENRNDYIKAYEEVRFLPGSREALRRLSRTKCILVLITNQSAIGRGIISLERAYEIDRRVVAEIQASGGRIEASYLCPHTPGEGCDCRKPSPGMLLRAAEELGIDLECSYLIGDALSDMLAARAAGVRGILVLTGRGPEQVSQLKEQGLIDCLVMADLGAAADHILSKEGQIV